MKKQKNWPPEKIARRARRSRIHGLNQLRKYKEELAKSAEKVLSTDYMRHLIEIMGIEEAQETVEIVLQQEREVHTQNRFITDHGLLVLDPNGDMTSDPWII